MNLLAVVSEVGTSIHDDDLILKISWLLSESDDGGKSNEQRHLHKDERYLSSCILLSRITSSSIIRQLVWVRFPSIGIFITRLLRFYLNRQKDNQNKGLLPLPLLQLAVMILTKMYSFDIEEANDKDEAIEKEGNALLWNETSWKSHAYHLGQILSVRGTTSTIIHSVDVDIVQAFTLLLTYHNFDLTQQPVRSRLVLTETPLEDESISKLISHLPEIILERIMKRSDSSSKNVFVSTENMSSPELYDAMASELIENILQPSSLPRRDVGNQEYVDFFTDYVNMTLVFLEIFMMYIANQSSFDSTTDLNKDSFHSIIIGRKTYLNMIEFSLRMDKVNATGSTDCYYDKQRFILLTFSFIQQGLYLDSLRTDFSQDTFNIYQTFIECRDQHFIHEVSRLLLVGLLIHRGNPASDNAKNRERDLETKIESLDHHSIRISSLETLVFLLEILGSVSWLIRPVPNTFDVTSRSVQLDGSFSLLCVILRLSSGELQIAMDEIMDIFMYKYFDSHTTEETSATAIRKESCTLENNCKIIIACIGIALGVLQELVILQGHMDEPREADIFRTLTPQSILHIRESFQVMINSVVTLLSHDIESTYLRWSKLLSLTSLSSLLPLISDCFVACCRYMTTYADEIDLSMEEEPCNEYEPNFTHHFTEALKNVQIFCNITNQHI